MEMQSIEMSGAYTVLHAHVLTRFDLCVYEREIVIDPQLNYFRFWVFV